MPELPEVEAVKTGLAEILNPTAEVVNIELLSPKLRAVIPPAIQKDLIGQTLVLVHRRAKYILFELNEWTMISHLGMTGSWRKSAHTEPQILHDHFAITFKVGAGGEELRLIYNDPRRFGVIDYAKNSDLAQNQWLRHLGVEPLDVVFTADYLAKKAKGRKTAVKVFIMDQKNVVGVGNIYASEALFMARIKPKRAAHRVTRAEWGALVAAIQKVLRQSIASGGTTLKDYRQVSGEKGGFQKKLLVYDREGELCRRCLKNGVESAIRMAVIVGRSTYWCNTCQK